MRIEIKRITEGEKQTEGVLTVFQSCGDGTEEKVFQCYTLELPWLDNKARISCIPKNIYNVEKRTSTKYKEHFHILDVPNRSYILIHNANYVTQTLGCVLVGKTLTDINNDVIDIIIPILPMNIVICFFPRFRKITTVVTTNIIIFELSS